MIATLYLAVKYGLSSGVPNSGGLRRSRVAIVATYACRLRYFSYSQPLIPPHVATADFEDGGDAANFTEQFGTFFRRILIGAA